MSETFNPYHRWLGIPPKHQPPNHYRLLGLELFENDMEVIRDAAERQMAHVRGYQLGQYSELSQKILNELGAAKGCLSDPADKAEYDRQLREQTAEGDRQLKEQEAELEPPPLPRSRKRVSWKDAPVVWAASAVGVLLLIALVLLTIVSLSRRLDESGKIAAAPPSPPQEHKNVLLRPEEDEQPAPDTTAARQASERPGTASPPPKNESQLSATETPAANEPMPESSRSIKSTAGLTQQSDKKQEATVTAPNGTTLDLGGGVKLEMVLIPAGEFMMGSPDWDKDADVSEKPQHLVRITKPFYLGTYLVMQEQWQTVMGNNPSHLKGGKNPVEQVSWNDCQTFLGKLNEKFGAERGKFQLPSEAQWEYACRAGSTTRYCYGDEELGLGEYAWYNANSGGRTHPVGEKKPNACGLYDMQGNVWEWCADWYDNGYYAASPTDDPTGPTSGSGRVLRGGCWSYLARDCRSTYRLANAPGIRNRGLGLRVSLVPADMAVGIEVAPPTALLKLCPIEAQAVEAGKPLNVKVTLEDADAWAGKVRYALSGQVPSGAKIDPQSGNFTWTPTAGQARGEHNITVSVTAPDGRSHQRSFAVTVTTLTFSPKPPSHKEIAIDLGAGVKLKMVLIPPGEFLMGSSDSDKDANVSEKPQHRVQITKPFYLGKYLVTQEQWQTVMGNNPSSYKSPKNPVEHVSWDDCQQFLDKLNAKSGPGGSKFQLPSEVQWEYACRAGSTTRYCFGDDESGLDKYAWYGENAGKRTHPVGEKKPNAWGLYDMHGNVLEWCADWYDREYYAASPADDPTGPTSGSRRVIRGGSWSFLARFCRSAYRVGSPPETRSNNVGLRVSRVPVE
jgi:formylglycine-generating enzyme required for sulfatase activity